MRTPSAGGAIPRLFSRFEDCMSRYDTPVKDSDRIGVFRRVIIACTGGGVLLTRYHIFNNRWFGVYLHHLQQSDEDRATHDHPWSFITILLTGGYWEIIGASAALKVWRPRWSILRNPAEWRHRLELPKPIWTLVFRGPERRVWGFYPDAKWMHHQEYGQKFCRGDW